jgi:hypothetical protein
MRTTTKLGVGAVGLLALVVGVGWLGLQIKPKPYPPHPEGTGELDVTELHSELPEPVYRHFHATLGEEVPQIETSVVWGRGDFNFNGLWAHVRFKSYHDPGRAFLRDQEITWFGMPVLRGADAYLEGKGSLDITGPFGLLNISGSGEKFDQGQNLAMWAEAPYTTPSVLVLDPRVRWEPIDDTSARLIVPLGEQEEDSLRVEFDPETGLMTRMSGMRYRGQEETKTPWSGEYSDWGTARGIKVPHRLVGTWED